MTTIKEKHNVDEIVQALRDGAGELDYNEQEARIFIQAVRTLIEGKPLTHETLAIIGSNHDVSGEEVDAVLNWIAERNDENHIVGLQAYR